MEKCDAIDACEFAIEIIHKYQKIEKLVNEWEEDSKGFRDYMGEISGVLEDGKIN